MSRARVVLGLSVVLGGLLGGVAAWMYHHHVVANPGDHLARSYVHAVLAQDAPVFYRDARTRVGVFFEDEHREWVSAEALPVAWTAAIVAAEDKRFWSHPGFDPVHILRAVRDNLSAGGLVAGGSTLTQQTAKNIYYRPDRTLRSKLREALDALRLEAHYTKPEILAFYANQFHVTGNGRGLGIAARHFFDKRPEELSTLEAAFLAGLVKAPSWYDPFLGDAARREAAIARGHARTTYVLRRLAEERTARLVPPAAPGGDATEQAAWEQRQAEVVRIQREAQQLLDDGFELPFKRGVFRFDASALLDEVARRLAQPPFAEVLDAAGIDDPVSAGVQVITTLDPAVQAAATYGLWHHLTEVGALLEGPDADAFLRNERGPPRFDPDHPPRPLQFRDGVVAEVLSPGSRPHLRVDLGGSSCVVDRAGVVRASVALHRGALGDPNARIDTAQVNAFVDSLPIGSVVWVSVRELRGDLALCDLELRPELQGAVVVIEGGRIRAMVGGNDNRNFNRAGALRQMGSTFKPLVVHAALELGWSPTDLLWNAPAVFPFSTTFYYPRADHRAPDAVSLGWSSVSSENIASVWLLYHLLDRLDPDQVAELAQALGLARGASESDADYRLRIQRSGVLPTPGRVREVLFLAARDEVARALERDVAQGQGSPDELVALRSLLYGWGFGAERRRTSADRRALLDGSWASLEPRVTACASAQQALMDALDLGLRPPAQASRQIRVELDEDTDALTLRCDDQGRSFDTVVEALLDGELRLPHPDELRFGALRLGTLRELSSAFERRRLQHDMLGEDAPGLYDPALLYGHQDFRVLLAMRYVTRLAQRLGVRTPLQEVLALPLGAAEVTLEDLTRLYEGLLTGEAPRFPGRGGAGAVPPPPDRTLLIAELRDAEGRVIYQAESEPERVTAPEVGALTQAVLQAAVSYGTGRRAKGAVQIDGAAWPLAGKTGTTNSYRNAAFVGHVPVAGDDGLQWGVGYTVGAYVGYDDNRPLTRGGLRLAGAAAALPAWVSTAQGLAASGLLAPDAARAGEGGWELPTPEGLVWVPVDPGDGGRPVVEADAADADLPALLRRATPRVAVLAELDLAPGPLRVAPSTSHAEADRGATGGEGVWSRARQEVIIPEATP